MGYRNIDVAAADGYAGWPQRAPFDVILVAAGSTEIPNTARPAQAWRAPYHVRWSDYARGGTGPATKTPSGSVTRCTLGLAAFVPMTGEARRIARGSSPRNQPSSAVIGLPQCFGKPVT